ncbi:hypothetical protein niasHT_033324 [Heterodera trifolii]|uniref:BTB domain-containing protein n=1 Tax=Heterodera trifolii TaxID=157864 RepID=A0ABD2I4M8_9BILA
MSDNLADHMKHLLVGTAQFAAQVHFLVGHGDGKELLLAHKNALVSASEVFEAMFRFDRNNGKAENGSADRPVEVPDVGAAAFKVMLSFIHTEELSGLDGDNATEVLYAAVKYNISGLIGHCLAALPNAFLALAHARLFGLEEFVNKYIRYIYKNGGPLFGTEEFLQIDQNLLSEIFDRDQLMISDEFEIWKACRQNAIECSAENRRSALGPALFKIRFPLIPTDTFEKQIVPSGVLFNDECVAISQFHSHYRPNLRGVPGLKPLKFPTQTRICDWNIAKANGAPPTLAFEIEKLSEFAREEEGSVRESALNVCINGGFQCYVSAKISTAMRGNSTEKWLGLCLGCCAASEDDWSFKCSATYRIISQKSGTQDLIGKYYDLIFNNDKLMYGLVRCISFAELMDPRKGFYDQNEDKVTCAIDVFMEEENRAKFDSDPNKSNGTIVMEIGKLSEFVREICSSARHSEAIQLNGLSWEIAANIETDEESAEKCLGFYLRCTAPTNDGKWSCNCSATYRIISQKSGTQDLIGKYYDRIFNDKHMYGFVRCISFAELMDPRKGFYDQNEDKVTCAIDVFMEEENRGKFDSDPNKSNGTIVMEIGKLSEFVREICSSARHSEAIQLNGLSWEIAANIETDEESAEKCLGFYLRCTAPTNDGKWSCKCSATYRIVSQKRGTEDLIGKYYDRIFNNDDHIIGFDCCISFAELMDPRKGFYDQNEDKMTCVIDVFMEEEKSKAKFDSDPNKSNGTIVMEIDKLSEFAREFCSSARHSEAIQLKDGKWTCKCSATLRIVSQKRGTDDFVLAADVRCVYGNNEWDSWHYDHNLISFSVSGIQNMAIW